MGLYGTQTTYPASLIIDKIYPNKAAMDDAAATDGIFPGRYVLVSYTGGAEAFEPAIKDKLRGCVQYSDLADESKRWYYDGDAAEILDWTNENKIPLTKNQKTYLDNLCADWNALRLSQTSKDASTYDGILYKKMQDDKGKMYYAAVANLTAAFNTIYQTGVGSIKTGEKGEVFNDTTNNVASGQYSHAEGSNTKATGQRAHAEGVSTQASGGDAHAEGQGTVATGWCAHAEGYQTRAKANFGHTEGNDTAVKGQASHSEGLQTRVYNENSHAEGNLCETLGAASHTEGYNTRAGASAILRQTTSNYGEYITNGKSNLLVGEKVTIRDKENGSFKIVNLSAKGTNYNSTNDQSYIYFAKDSGQEKIALGDLIIFKNQYADQEIPLNTGAHAEGCLTAAQGTASHAEGAKSFANADYSHAEGLETVAEGTASHASGIGTVASREASTAIGKYNKYDDDTIFSVGVGTSATDRKNALTIKEGKVDEKPITYVEIEATGPTETSVVTKGYADKKLKGLEPVGEIAEGNTNPVTSGAVYKEIVARPEKSYRGLSAVPEFEWVYGSYLVNGSYKPAYRLNWEELTEKMADNTVLSFEPDTEITYPKFVFSEDDGGYVPFKKNQKGQFEEWKNYTDSSSYKCMEDIYRREHRNPTDVLDKHVVYKYFVDDYMTSNKFIKYNCATANKPTENTNQAYIQYFADLTSNKTTEPTNPEWSFPEMVGLYGSFIEVVKRNNNRVIITIKRAGVSINNKTINEDSAMYYWYERLVFSQGEYRILTGWQKIYEDEKHSTTGYKIIKELE